MELGKNIIFTANRNIGVSFLVNTSIDPTLRLKHLKKHQKSYQIKIDFGDGHISSYNDNDIYDIEHTYENPNEIYNVKISNSLKNISFNNAIKPVYSKTNIISIDILPEKIDKQFIDSAQYSYLGI